MINNRLLKLVVLVFLNLIFLDNFKFLVSGQLLDITYQSSIIINNKLYFLGGLTVNTYQATNQIIYLDLTTKFSLNQTLPIKQNSLTSEIPSYYKASLALGGNNNETLYLISGNRNKTNYGSIIYSTNTSSLNNWNSVTFDGQSQLADINDTIFTHDSNGNTYITGNGVNNIYKFDIESLSIVSLKPLSNGPSIVRPSDFTCHLLNEESIVYIANNLNKLSVYNIKENNWYIITTAGDKPSDRNGHSSILVSDGRIVVYGGTDEKDKLAILDTTQNPFQWTVPTNIVHPVNELHEGHTANLYDNYMLIAFGWIATSPTSIRPYSNVLVLDVSDKNNYKWLDTYVPITTTSTESTTPTGSNPSKLTTSIPVAMIVGVTVGVPVLIALIITLILFIRRSNRKIGQPKKYVDE